MASVVIGQFHCFRLVKRQKYGGRAWGGGKQAAHLITFRKQRERGTEVRDRDQI